MSRQIEGDLFEAEWFRMWSCSRLKHALLRCIIMQATGLISYSHATARLLRCHGVEIPAFYDPVNRLEFDMHGDYLAA